MSANARNRVLYGRFLLFIAGLGGLLYGIDVGIIAAALLYLNKTINLSIEQTSLLVAAVLGGGTVSSLVAGFFADWFGRKKMMIVSGFMFVVSVGLIVVSQGFVSLFVGRLLQGMSGGVIAVVVPLYLAECLSSKRRGSGTAIFQFMLTFGIVVAALTGFFYTRQAEAAITAAAGNQELIRLAQNHAWRGMFLSVIYPGIIFFLGSFFLSETPRWLIRRGKVDAARAALLRSVSPEEAEIEMREMQALILENKKEQTSGSLFKRKYVWPFLLACIILSLNQTTGINSVMAYLVIILKQAGMTASHATQGDVVVKVLNCVMTIIGVALVDRKGRKFLLNLGTAGIVIAFLAGGIVFHSFESQKRDVLSRVQTSVANNALTIPINESTLGPAENGRPMALTVLYSTGSGNKVATVLSNDPVPVLTIPADTTATSPLVIKRAQYGPVPTETTGWLITICLALFITSYSFGPGVVVWLMLSELMPTRIRAMGMGIALLLNQGISTLIAGVFLPVVGNYGYFAMFFFWAGCTTLYFLTSAFLVPETKGKSLEEIEMYFERNSVKA
ncbi:sugar porter family MFS transporter [Acidicapsa ligni]|uniref:sugar porter family MFS transporter n=1 Tax=Acidicapsa ligni TaxID=542300 RepID=UPI0021E0DD58|nr:sugar porter family MFS transporter [Acidicapsa ligni]